MSDAQFDIQRDVTFAVVLYGGMSLAVYINGVVQELYSMMCATDLAQDSLSPSASVYREIAQLRSGRGNPIRERFVVDIIAGTSAGGINGILLAKAISCNLPLNMLHTIGSFWLSEGDVTSLINDKRSYSGLSARHSKDGPQSLFNSDRLYEKVREVLDVMDQATLPSRAVRDDELDLFLTTTDLTGVSVQLPLNDDLPVYELRHRHVLNFRASKRPGAHIGDGNAGPRNDFTAPFHKLLAFAARCTSAFPVAFSPMRLMDDGSEIDSAVIGQMFPGYGADIARRAFADGGYLDNKPFGHAAQTMVTRPLTRPVDRKLIYVEPAPKDPSPDRAAEPGDDFLAHLLQGVSIPFDERIRDDLLVLLQSSRLSKRIKVLFQGVENDLIHSDADIVAPHRWEKQFLNDIAYARIEKRKKGQVYDIVSYGSYLRLRVESLVDELAELLARYAGYSNHSEDYLEIRGHIADWQSNYFSYYRPDDAQKTESQHTFLRRYGLLYYRRRARFLIYKIDQWVGFLTDIQRANDGRKVQNVLAEWQRRLPLTRRHLRPWIQQQTGSELDACKARLATWRAEIAQLFEGVENIRERLNNDHAAPSGPPSAYPCLSRCVQHGADVDDIKKRVPTFLDRVNELLDPVRDSQDRFTEALFGAPGHGPLDVLKWKDNADELGDRVLDVPDDPADVADLLVRYYFARFAKYDILTYPILRSSEVAEEMDPIEVHRISPNNATAIRRSVTDKLAGVRHMHFGAFLDRAWRENDMLWGRLDAAEQIVNILLPKAGAIDSDRDISTAREHFIRKIHIAILEETFADPTTRHRLMDLDGITPSEQATWKGEDLYNAFKNRHRIKTLSARTAVESSARAANVFGAMLRGLAEKQGKGERPARVISNVGRLVWTVVQVSIPNSIPRLVFTHWIGLALLMGGVIVFGGWLSDTTSLVLLGWSVIGVALTIRIAQIWVGNQLVGRRPGVRVVKLIFMLGVAVVFVNGLLYFSEAIATVRSIVGNWLGQILPSQ